MGVNQIILINPLYRKNWEYVEDNPAAVIPLGILSIGTFLSNNGYDVVLIDACTDPDYEKKIKNILTDSTPLFVGISAMTAQIYSALEIASLVRRLRGGRDIPIVWGGIHPTILPENTITHPLVDIAVIGPGEYTTLELAETLSSDVEVNLGGVRGIVFKNGEKIIFTPQRDFVDLNELPFIDYELIDIKKYIYRALGYGETAKRSSLILYTGIGCPFRCAFCANVALHKRKYSGKSAERILQELDYFVEKYKVEYVSFCDELFFVNKNRIREFIDGLAKREYKIQWYANVRADCFKPDFLSEDMVCKMKEVGCSRLGMGVESGSQRMLNEVIKKDIKLEYVLEAARLCSKYDITVGYSFMMGLPGEKRSDTIKTVNLMHKIKKIHPGCFFFGPQIYIPFPGSELYVEAVRFGFRDPVSLDEWARVEADKSLQAKLSGAYLWSSFDPAQLPWIEDVSLIRQIDFIQNFIFRDIGKMKLDFKYPLKVLLVVIAKCRVKTKFWVFPFEYWIYYFFVNSYMAILNLKIRDGKILKSI